MGKNHLYRLFRRGVDRDGKSCCPTRFFSNGLKWFFDRGLRLIAASFGVGGSDAVSGMLFWSFINDHLVLASCFLD